MRLRCLPLAALFALAACNGSPTAPAEGAAFSSGFNGSGHREAAEGASLNSALIGSGNDAQSDSADSPALGGSTG